MWTPVEFEYQDQACEARLRQGAIVYRLTSEAHSDPLSLLNGQGAIQSAENGRYHAPGQIASYCASNALVTFAEVLFHMYRRTLNAVSVGSLETIFSA